MTRRSLPFSVICKPTGSACNLDCSYCFFLSKEVLYDHSSQAMTEATLRTYLVNFLASQPDGDVTIAWQGGEPTMRGLDFFREAVRLADALKRPGQRLTHTIQTNGTLLDDEWAAFLAEHRFLVGLSIDGPDDLHDAYRVNRAGRGSYKQVIRGWDVLAKHNVDVNILCTVHAANQGHPLRVYRHFRDDLGARFLQFIPIVERVEPARLADAERGWRTDSGERLLYRQAGDAVTSRSVTPASFGEFMTTIWDEWLPRDVGTVFVQHFDVALANRLGLYSLCVHAPECGTALALEHNGDVYACDHFVEPGYLLGNVARDDFSSMLESPAQRGFGKEKRSLLTRQCRDCPVLWACNGGCPKDRFATSADGEPGQNYLCEGYFAFFSHISAGIDDLAARLTRG